MAKALLGRKIGMTQVFAEDGTLVPVTAVEAGPCPVVQIKTEERDGYSAAQIGLGEVKEARVNSPLKGHFKKGKADLCKYLAEVRLDPGDEMKVGQTLKADIFESGERADVIGISKGKGFQGVVRRHNFHGGRATHGSHFHRAPGSVGQASSPSRVFKGLKLPGQMGNAQVTGLNLEVVRVDADQNMILLRGSVPGAQGSVIMIRGAVKSKG